MTRRDAIEHYKFVVNTVFKAEGKVKPRFLGLLAVLKFLDKDDPKREQIADEYLTAIATEIVGEISDEELAKLKIE